MSNLVGGVQNNNLTDKTSASLQFVSRERSEAVYLDLESDHAPVRSEDACYDDSDVMVLLRRQ